MRKIFKNLHRNLYKDKYIKVIDYKKDKSIKIRYYHEEDFKPDFLINNNHIFLHNGYRTILISDSKKETINPLDLKSAYPVEKFQTAIESKVIKDVFNDLRVKELDITKILLIGNIVLTAILLYYQVIGGNI